MEQVYQHFINSGLSPNQAMANAEAAANALPLPYDIPNYTAPGQVDTFGDTAVEMMREPWSQAKADWSRVQPGSGFGGLGAAGSAGLNALTALGGGGAGLLSEIVPDIGGRGADNNELAFARDFLGFGDAFAGGGIGRGVNMLDDLIDAGADGAGYAGRGAADLARRIEVDPNALGSMGGNIRLRPQADAPFDMARGMGDNGGPAIDGDMPSMIDVLNARAKQMALKPADRIQPAQGGAGIFDRDYATPAPSGILPDLSKRYVRNPDPSSPLPKGDRARVLVDKADQISDLLAERIRATGQMDADTRYFYHTDGPVYRAAKKAGLSDDEAAKYLADLGDYVAATSPRTKVEENLRNASLVMTKQAQGVPFREIVGPGTVDPKTGVRGISEKGYPLMTGKGGIHGNLLDDVIDNGGMNVANNPKPSNFGPNIAGNRSGVTVDTHAIRGTLQTLNEMEPGSVPEGFILPKFRDAYKSDPSVLTPNMIDDTLAGQMIGSKGNTTKAQTEYAVFADIWHKAADRLGVSPAEAQSMGWFGFGDETNLGSARKTPVDIFDERIDVTAKAMGISPEKAAEGVFRRQIPLLGVGGLGLLSAMPQQEQQQGLLQ